MEEDETEGGQEAAIILSAEEHQKVRDRYVEWADKQIEQLTDRHTRSGEDFDKQIVALAGGGLALTITLAKDMLDKNTAQLVGVLIASWAGLRWPGRNEQGESNFPLSWKQKNQPSSGSEPRTLWPFGPK